MKKTEMVKTNEFKELVKEFMIGESYGACDVRLHYEQYGLSFKPRATDMEIESRIHNFTTQYPNKDLSFSTETQQIPKPVDFMGDLDTSIKSDR